MKYKFAHFADVHWRGLTRHEEYKRAFEDAFETLRKEQVDAIFIAGDIVHSKTQGISPELIDSLCWWFRELSKIASVYVTLGNHDGLIMNKDREDAISPIIRALNLHNVRLSKFSETFEINDEIAITNFSCFDEEKWATVNPKKEKINIALFHGAVTGSETDINWELDGEVDEGFFEGFDFVFLGDIHKHQYLDESKRIAYCGSTIQQNFGETPDKGFMIWEIDDKETYRSRHIKVKHDMPYVTIDWKGTVSETLDEADVHPDKARFRIRTTVPISQGEIKQIYSALKEFKNASEIVMKQDVEKPDLVLENVETSKKPNLRDPQVISKMVKEYFKRANLPDHFNEKLEENVHRFWKSVSKVETSSSGRWSVKSLEFDNVFGYGKGNKINFSDMDGITGIFGKNRIGKSSVCGTLMYTMFNTTDRGSISNLHVINSRKGHCKASAIISKRGKNYKIERQSIKKEARSGKLSVSTQLNLFEVDPNGDVIKDMCGEQRRETEKSLKTIVGSSDDFLLTSFASQGEMNAFINQKASSRKAVLSKFLDLDVFDQLNEAAKAESSSVRQMIRNVPERDYDLALVETRNKLKVKVDERDILYEKLDALRKRIRSLDLNLETRDDKNIVTSHDVFEQASIVSSLKEKRSICSELIEKLSSEKEILTEKTAKIQTIKENFPLEDLREALDEQRDLDDTTIKLKHRLDKERQKLKVLNNQVSVLDQVPCGDSFPECKFIVDAHKSKKKLRGQSKNIETLSEDLKVTRAQLRKMQDKDLEGKLSKFNALVAEFGDLSIKKSQVELKISDAENDLEKTKASIESEIKILDEMKVNVSSDENADTLSKMRKKLRDLRGDETQLADKISKTSEDVGLLQAKIEKLVEEKASYEKLIEEWRVYELFMQATSKNGLPLEIIRSRLPEINAEIASILQGVTGFTVELESNEGSNDMEVFINYGDSKRIIECCSGMEKMMSAMAIRVALTNVSELSKSDLFIIDEGFGALDDGNIEACSRFLESLKKWFRCILIISHVDAVKDAVDNVLEISRDGKDAVVRQE